MLGLAAWLAAAPPAAHEAARHAAPAATTAPATAQPTARRPWGPNHFPNVPLITQHGKVVRFYDDLLKGKAVVINLIYTRCEDLCPLETARLSQVRQLLGEARRESVHFYSLSIDPEHDTPPVLKAYAEKFQVGKNWLFLTGQRADIARLAKQLGLSSLTDAADRDGHLPALMIGKEPSGEWMRLSATDNPRFLASKIESFLGGWQTPPTHAAPSYAAARPITELDPAAYLFRTRCGACHTVGRGDAVGPDLRDVTRRRERSWLARFIKAPETLLAAQDPIATELFARYQPLRMPNLQLADHEVQALIDYLDAQRPVAGEDLTDAGAPATAPAH